MKIDLGKVVGADGKSAYQIAVEHGFEGTEQEWIDSLSYDDDISALDEKINQEIEDRTNADTEIQNTIESTVNNAIAELVANAPEDLDTLKEIADWIDTHEDSASAMNTAILENKNAIAKKADSSHTHDDRYYTKTSILAALETKVDKENGKGLSTNDFTDTYKTKLDGLSNYDDTDLQNEKNKKLTIIARNSISNCYGLVAKFSCNVTPLRITGYTGAWSNATDNRFIFDFTCGKHSNSDFSFKTLKGTANRNIPNCPNIYLTMDSSYIYIYVGFISSYYNVYFTIEGNELYNLITPNNKKYFYFGSHTGADNCCNLPSYQVSLYDEINNGNIRVLEDFVLKSDLENLSVEGHTHDDRYYTETEIDTKLSSKIDSSHLTNWNCANINYTGNPNDCEIGKWYSINTVLNSTNMPKVNGWANVITFAANNNSSYKQQLCYYNNENVIYTRTQITGAWGSWERVAKSSELDSKADSSHTHDELVVTELPSGTDLNSVNLMAYDCKEFYSADGGTYSNAPSNYFTLRLIETENGGCVQLFCSHENGTVKLYSRAFLRVIDNYYWTEWSSLANIDEINTMLNAYATKTELSGKADSSHEHTSLKRTQIDAGTDLNTLTIQGEYFAIDNESYPNAPCNNFTMQVIRLMSGYTFQILYAYASNRIYTRSKIWGSSGHYWTSWREHVQKDDLSTYALKSDLANAGMSVSAKNVMEATGSIDFNTNKAILQLPIYSADAAYYPTEQGAMWIQEIREDEE